MTTDTKTNVFNLQFELQNETKGAVRYGERLDSSKIAQAPNDPGAVVGTLYLRKSAFPGATSYPSTLKVTIEG